MNYSQATTEPCAANDQPPPVRCYLGHRAKWEGRGWICCARCCWSSHDSRRVGWRWRLRVLVGR